MRVSSSNIIIFGSILIFTLGLLSFNVVISNSQQSESGGGVPCINPALSIPQNLHIHPRLRIVVNGKEEKIPTNIGLSFGCERAVHTHDTTGEIHVEPNYPRDFTLGDFFAVWGKPFSKNQILDYLADADHEVVLTVEGVSRGEYEGLILKDKQNIVIEYRTKGEKR
jgi:hypothetical protein